MRARWTTVGAVIGVTSAYLRIIFRHMAPNVVAPYLVMLTSFLGQAILLETSLCDAPASVLRPIDSPEKPR